MTYHLLAIAGLIGVLLAWVGVQLAWKKVFPGVGSDPDVLAGRMGCNHGCDCQEDQACKRLQKVSLGLLPRQTRPFIKVF